MKDTESHRIPTTRNVYSSQKTECTGTLLSLHIYNFWSLAPRYLFP